MGASGTNILKAGQRDKSSENGIVPPKAGRLECMYLPRTSLLPTVNVLLPTLMLLPTVASAARARGDRARSSGVTGGGGGGGGGRCPPKRKFAPPPPPNEIFIETKIPCSKSSHHYDSACSYVVEQNLDRMVILTSMRPTLQNNSSHLFIKVTCFP